MNSRPPGQFSFIPLTVVWSRACTFPNTDRLSRQERIGTSVPYARLGTRKFLEVDGKGNKGPFPTLHQLENSESI